MYLTGKTTWKLVTHEPPLIPGTKDCGFICSCNNAIELTTPLLYDMSSDPGEIHPINVKSDVYNTLSDVILTAINTHKQSIKPIESQFLIRKLLPRFRLATLL